MPYKHIAAHLKKTELACRLHFHQLSHGSNRRKRTTSVSSASSTGGHSPTMLTSIPSPIQEDAKTTDLSRSNSPPSSAGSSYSSTTAASCQRVQLPRIMTGHGHSTTSPRLPAILPKPTQPDPVTQRAPPAAPAPYRGPVAPTSATPRSTLLHHHPSLPGPLRLDCSGLPPPPTSAGFSSTPSSATYSSLTHHPLTHSHPVDMSRLASIYATHRASIWTAIAADYGNGANPLVLEQAWRGTGCTATGSMGPPPASQMTPVTPCGSPDDHLYGKHDKTRISAILGIDASPRSPQEREMVKRIEEERVV